LTQAPHVPVLLAQVLELFARRTLRRFCDGTLGAGGHAAALLEAHPELEEYVGIDRDPVALEIAARRLELWKNKVTLVRAAFADMPEGPFDGILLDIGVSSMQLDTPTRGFSFKGGGELDMRMNPDDALTAYDVVNHWSRKELLQLCEEGEVPRGHRVVDAIIAARPIETTDELAEIVRPVIGRAGRSMDPATLLFQALRMAVNDELGQLRSVLPLAMQRLAPHGRLAVISFHSLEDRIVKNTFRASGMTLVTKKPLVATQEEIRRNKRARSAKLRCVEKSECTD
jgi:16S rRNA (cytosine1402-N4)-methyltransferase